tara:strand:+ start:252 stop:425 length:174 start_codon:yes stop_codon:yes gene_type:complete
MDYEVSEVREFMRRSLNDLTFGYNQPVQPDTWLHIHEVEPFVDPAAERANTQEGVNQ